MIDSDLIEARRMYDARQINADQFALVVNHLMANDLKKSLTNEEKVAFFDKLVEFFPRNYEIVELVDGRQGIKSDLADYLFEEVLKGAFGKKIFDFWNETYESF